MQEQKQKLTQQCFRICRYIYNCSTLDPTILLTLLRQETYLHANAHPTTALEITDAANYTGTRTGTYVPTTGTNNSIHNNDYWHIEPLIR